MRNNINTLIEYLDRIDSQPTLCLNFMDKPEFLIQHMGNVSLHLSQSDSKLKKMDIMFAMVRSTVLQFNYPRDLEEIETKVKEIYLFIDTRFTNYAWRVHSTHKHQSFGHFVNCPCTSASEISEVLNKIIGDYFHA